MSKPSSLRSEQNVKPGKSCITVNTKFRSGCSMDGKSLYRSIIESVQEMNITIGDTMGSTSLYYPFAGDLETLKQEFFVASKGSFPGVVLEQAPERVKVTVSEDDCKRIALMPVKETMKDVLVLVSGNVNMDNLRRHISQKYPDSRFGKTGGVEFDWALAFPEDVDDNVYCFSEEMGSVTCHRFSREEYLAFGFQLP